MGSEIGRPRWSMGEERSGRLLTFPEKGVEWTPAPRGRETERSVADVRVAEDSRRKEREAEEEEGTEETGRFRWRAVMAPREGL